MALATPQKAATSSNATPSDTSSTEVTLSATDKIFYPQLIRLRDDFTIKIMSDIDKTSSQKYFFLFDPKAAESKASSSKKGLLTPFFDSLTDLEDHVEDNILDLLHHYLCG